MKSRFVLLAACAAIFMSSCMKKEGTATDSSSNAKADSMKTAYKAMAAAWDAGNAEEMDKYVSVNSMDHNLMPGYDQGLAGMKKMVKDMKAGFPDQKSTIEDMRVDGDILTARFKFSGTNSGPMMGMPATNKKVTDVMGMDQVRWENGKFVEHWGLMDMHSMMTQLGIMPSHDAAPASGDMSKPMGKDMGGDKKKM